MPASVITVEDDVKHSKAPSPVVAETPKAASLENLPPPKKKGLEPLPSIKSPEPEISKPLSKIEPLSLDEEKKGIQEMEQKLSNIEKSNMQASYEKKKDTSGDYADDFDDDI
jgi:hypothetical protein